MIFIIGGAYQGKLDFAVSFWKSSHSAEPSVCSELTGESAKHADIIQNLHLYIKKRLETLSQMEQDFSETSISFELFCAKQLLEEVLALRAGKPNIIFTMTELGCGVVPVQSEDRRYREICGRISCVLAMLSEQTWKITCGIGTLLAEHDFLTIALIRHGKTKGNEEKRYIGQTDESLSPKGIAEITRLLPFFHRIHPDVLFSSPLKRCLETAGLLFPELSPIRLPQLRETNFGKFEGKNCEELNRSPELSPLWQAWINSNGTLPFPDGESPEDFTRRTVNGFSETMTNLLSADPSPKTAAFLLHGGSIMALLDTYVPKDYFHRHDSFYSWQVSNTDGYLLLLDKKDWLAGKQSIYPIGQLKHLLQ